VTSRDSQRLGIGLPEHPDQHRPERPILLPVDQELQRDSGLGASLASLDVGSVTKRLPTAPRVLRPLSLHHTVEAPAIGNALQFPFADVIERETRARDEVLDCLRDQHLRRSSR
jgi:hypothetical protein